MCGATMAVSSCLRLTRTVTRDAPGVQKGIAGILEQNRGELWSER